MSKKNVSQIMENKFPNFMSDEEWNERLSTLTKKQLLYFQMMVAKSGVLYIEAKPGVAKSATARAIADKMNFHYEDMRLSMSDETDFKLPHIKQITDKDGVTHDVSKYAIPEWAFLSNERPTIIHFEELNRAPLFVRNAALQILLEREIGTFKFNDNVLMMASGNLGEEDNTDVEEFDAALNNRLIPMAHSISFDEWYEDFANGRICPTILSFLKTNMDKLYVAPTENCKSYATPRSWTFLSDFIFETFGSYKKDENGEYILDENGKKVRVWGEVTKWHDLITNIGRSYIGDTNRAFVRYIEDELSLTLDMILNDYHKHEKDIKNLSRDRKSEFIQPLKDIANFRFEDLSDKQVDNLIEFLKVISSDERMSVLITRTDKDNVDIPNLKKVLRIWKKDLVAIQDQNIVQVPEITDKTGQ